MTDSDSLLPRLLQDLHPGRWIPAHLAGILRQGRMPRNVAFIMDGNRRYTKKHGLDIRGGSLAGAEALFKLMAFCMECGITTVNGYWFSLENYKRPQSQVDGLLKALILTYGQLHSTACQYGVSVRVLGQRDMVPEDFLDVIEHLEASTKDNTRGVLNMCFAYTSRAEMTTAIQTTVDEFSGSPSLAKLEASRAQMGLRERLLRTWDIPLYDQSPENCEQRETQDHEAAGNLQPISMPTGISHGRAVPNASKDLPDPNTITVETLERHLYTAKDPNLDMVVRTSGAERLSDFMLWQLHQNTRVYFLPCLWPEISVWKFAWMLLDWQRNQPEK